MAASKEKFIAEISKLLEDVPDFIANNEEAYEYWLLFKDGKSGESKGMTETGGKVLKFMQEQCELFNNIFSAQNIGEGLFMPPRSISGSMRKLISDGYVEKIGVKPTTYALTDAGKEYLF